MNAILILADDEREQFFAELFARQQQKKATAQENTQAQRDEDNRQFDEKYVSALQTIG